MSWSLLRAGKGGDKKKKRQSCVAPGSIPSPGVTAVCRWALDEIRKSTEVTARGGGTESAAEKGSA